MCISVWLLEQMWNRRTIGSRDPPIWMCVLTCKVHMVQLCGAEVSQLYSCPTQRVAILIIPERLIQARLLEILYISYVIMVLFIQNSCYYAHFMRMNSEFSRYFGWWDNTLYYWWGAGSKLKLSSTWLHRLHNDVFVPLFLFPTPSL